MALLARAARILGPRERNGRLVVQTRNPQHPDASEAKDLLELFLDPDEEYGNDWNKWQTKMAQWLKENPD